MEACAFVPSAPTATDSPVVTDKPVATGTTAAADFAVELASLAPFLLKRAMHLTKKRELAEDLAQTTLARALQGRDLFTPGTNMKGWVATILHHEFYSHHRRAWRSASWSDAIADTLAAPLGEQESSLDLQRIACALDDLPEGQREALVAVGLLGFAYEEVATLLDCSTGTIKSRVSRARMSLLQIMQARGTAGRRLIPTSPRAFAGWLIDLEAIRLAAQAKLAGKAPAAAKLPALRKIALKATPPQPVLRLHPARAAGIRHRRGRLIAAPSVRHATTL
jgi:RNA polymerase sigma-70 factor (ECF subfamily)